MNTLTSTYTNGSQAHQVIVNSSKIVFEGTEAEATQYLNNNGDDLIIKYASAEVVAPGETVTGHLTVHFPSKPAEVDLFDVFDSGA